MGLIDSHTHLESFVRANTLPEILRHAREADLEAMITIGTSSDDWDLYRSLAESYPGFVYYTVGLHPGSVEADWADQLGRIADYWKSVPGPSRPVALGEMGLDRFHLPKDPGEADRVFWRQRMAFAEGLAIAKRLEAPIVVHSRNAFRECVEMIDASGVDWRRVIFHCFVEGPAEMEKLMSRGGWSSFTGVLTYKSAENVRAAARHQGLARLILETDAPYLTPVPLRGKPNEPAYVKHTADFAAGVFGVGADEIARTSTAAAREFFGLDTSEG